MPKELVEPFLRQGRRTFKQYVTLAVVGTVLIKLGVPQIVEAVDSAAV